MNWDRPILTDSGGFQIFSLGTLRKITEEGVDFQSHIDGSRHFLSPERAVEIQEALGSRHHDVPRRVHRLSRPSAATMETGPRADRPLGGALQGRRRNDAPGPLRHRPGRRLSGPAPARRRGDRRDRFRRLCPRRASASASPRSSCWRPLAATAPLLPEDRPRYLMGVGTPEDLVDGVYHGIDMFDCVMPTRSARNGLLFTNRRKGCYKKRPLPGGSARRLTGM